MSETNGKGTGDARINLKLSFELKDFADEYARRRETSVSQLLRDYLIYLQKEEERNARGQGF
tara:strand:+ start:216 stop:401 length:186 start_codon:yes stop_codon:yes gene_type:complete